MTIIQESLPDLLMRTTIELRQLDNHGMPVDFASGCLVENAGNRFVLTVTPKRERTGNWHIPMYNSYSITTVCHVIRTMNTRGLQQLTDDGTINREFNFAQLPGDCRPLLPHFDNQQNIVYSPVEVLSADCSIYPSASLEYGFFCQSNFKTVDDKYLHCDELVITEMLFVGLQNNYYMFNIPATLRRQDLLLNACGAPILDSSGKLVALVAGYFPDMELLAGLPLYHFSDLPFGKSVSH